MLPAARIWLLFFLTHFFSYFCVLGENADDGIGRGHFAGEIQMCINVACCADVAVTEPLLNLFQAHTIGVEQAGAAMAKVMETDAFHVVRNKEIGKMLGKIIRMKAHSHRVHIDVVEIIRAVIFAADLPIQLLLLFHLFKHLLTGRDKGKCPAARFGFGPVACYIRHNAIDFHTDNGMLNADFLVLKVNENQYKLRFIIAKHVDFFMCLRYHGTMEVVPMINRPLYVDKIMAYTDTPFVKVLTGFAAAENPQF